MIDCPKTDVLRWEREGTAAGSHWIESGDGADAARERWSESCPE